MVDSDVFQKFVEYPPENGTITKILYEYDMAAPINEHPDCSEQCLRDVEDLVKDPEDDVVDIKLCGTKIIKVEPDRYRAIREKTNYEDVPTHPNILKISHFTYHERTDCYVFVYDLGCKVTTLSEFVKTATLEDRKCLVEQVIKLVQHFHTHRILYSHLQPDLMYVALSENDRKPQLKVGSFLKTAFCDTRTEIPDFSGSCKEESTMLEDLKDAAHVIAFIYNQGDTARTTNAADKVMKELQSMSLDIEASPTESVMLQIWSVLYIPDKTQSLVRFSFKNSQVEQPRIELLSQLNNIEVSAAMLEEENRYCSFPEEWERLHPDLPSRQQLAKAGFFHECIESAVNIEFSCAFCGIKVPQVGTLHWRRGEDVDKEHQRINPSCSFYNSQSNAIVSNV